jgi:hypothetical protein
MLRMRRELASLGHRDDAMLEAAERADQLLDDGVMAGAETRSRIIAATEEFRPLPFRCRPCFARPTCS